MPTTRKIDRTVQWVSASGVGKETLRIRTERRDIVAEGIVISARERPYELRYRVVCDEQWRIREAELSIVGTNNRLYLRSDGAGTWAEETGLSIGLLRACMDIDISATPFTNTLPIRRLGLKELETQEIKVVYVAVPELVVVPVLQRYTCLEAERLYRYEGLSTGAEAKLVVDADGLVIEYPNRFRQIHQRSSADK